MTLMDKIKIQISRDTWKSLNGLKEAGDTFDKVIEKLVSYWWKKQKEGEL